MPSSNQVRDGGNSIVIAARALIILVTTFQGALRQKYGAGSAIDLLCTAIVALGNLLPAADEEVVEYGGDNAVPETNPEEILGINPAAEAPPTPLE